jgi:retron-type reverse transcriptase
MRYEKVIERVYDPRRLRTAWKQIKKNAGAAGIDQMSVEDFDERRDELLQIIHEKLKAGIYRFRPARRVLIPKEGSEWCAFIDLASFFDEIPHNLILKLIRRKISDERLVTLIARALKAGIMEDGQYKATTKGCPQGSPLSPMLSNIVLNELDHELEKRGHRYCRWADDFVIIVKS